MTRIKFTDGYAEWKCFDEDGSVEESSAEVTGATVAPGVIDVTLYQDADPKCAYEIHLEAAGESWRGTFRRLVDERPNGGGKCNGRVVSMSPDELQLDGRWIEHDTPYRWSMLLRSPAANAFVAAARTIYDRFAPDNIHPYVGAAFQMPRDDTLRIVAVGINAYVSANDWPKRSPKWFASWFTPPRDRYQRGVCRDLKDLANTLTAPGTRFSTKRFAGMDSLYLTNAVKVYAREATGKRAAQLSDRDFDRHLDQWREELDAMAEHDALPHVLAIIGDPFWSQACATFRDGTSRMTTKKYEWCDGPCLHYVNRITLDLGSREHELLLVRLRHPASRRATGSPKWLAQQAAFRTMIA